MTNPYEGLSAELDVDPASEQRRRELQVAQGAAQQVTPEAAALAARRAEQQGVPFDTAVRQQTPEVKDAYDWGALEREAPVLARSLRTDPQFAAVAQDDVENLAWWERWFGGVSDIAWETKEAWKRGGGDTFSPGFKGSADEHNLEPTLGHKAGRGTVQLGVYGWLDLMGQSTPETLAQIDQIQEEQKRAGPPKELGYIPGIFPAAAESLPLMLRGGAEALDTASKGVAVGAVGGAVVGSAAGGVGALPGALVGGVAVGGAGLKLGMAESAGRAEAGLAWLEYKKTPGVDLESARLAAKIVGVVNGTLEMASFATIAKRFPVVERFLNKSGLATRDVFRRVFGDATKRAAFARLAGRVAEGALVEGGTEFVQELSTILGGVYAGDTISADEALARAWEAGKKGAQGGVGMSLPGTLGNLATDISEAKRALQRQTFYEAMGVKAAESKLAQRLPAELAKHLDRIQQEAGGAVESLSVPAPVLKQLFQTEGISDKRVLETMPGVAKQLAEADVNPTAEVVIPTAQFAAHIAPLKSFATIQQDIRVGDGMTMREAKPVMDEAAKILEEMKPKEGKGGEKEVSPAARVFNDVAVKLKNAGYDEDTARTDAAIWAAMASSRASRGLAKDAFEYYEKQLLEVGHEELQGAEVEAFNESLGKLRANPPENVAQDPVKLARMAARRSLGERFAGYRVLTPEQAKIVDEGGSLGAGRAFLSRGEALAEAARSGGRAAGVMLGAEDITGAGPKGELEVGELPQGRVTLKATTLGQLSPEAVALADRVAKALEAVAGPAVGAEVALPPHPTMLLQVERDAEGKVVRDETGSVFPAWRKKTVAWMEKNGYSAEEIQAHLGAVEGQMAIFSALTDAQIELLPRGAREQGLSKVSKKKGPLRKNVDPIYKISFDASAMCVKRLEAAATQAHIEQKLHRSLTASERLALVALFKQAGKTAPCLYCYVEAPRGKGGDFVKAAIDVVTGVKPIPGHWKADAVARAKAAVAAFKGAKLTPADIDATVITDPARRASKVGQRAVATHPDIYDFLEQQYNYAKVNKPKLYEEYNGQILDVDEKTIQELNRYAGFRFFSTSDFQAEHVIDLIQAFRDLSLRGAKAHAYTKVADFVEIFGPTGMKIQTSIFAKPDGKGGFVEDSWQGMKWEDAKRLREKFGNVGTVLVATSDEMVTWALEQPWVDYIIPFHYSGLEKKYYAEMKWQDFTATQNEKSLVKGQKAKKIRMHELDVAGGISNEEGSARYRKLADERQLRPVFQKWKDHPQFFKLKKDYARTDTSFDVVDADKIDMDAVGRVLETVWQGTAPREQKDVVIAEQLLRLIKSGSKDIGVTALRAIEDGVDINTAVRQEAKASKTFPGARTLKQVDREHPAVAPQDVEQSVEFEALRSHGGDRLAVFSAPGVPIELKVMESFTLDGTGRMVVVGQEFTSEARAKKTEKELQEEWGGEGRVTALYLKMLEVAMNRGWDIESDGIRSQATQRMYLRLEELGIPVEFEPNHDKYALDVAGSTGNVIRAKSLTSEMLDTAWRTLQAEAEIKKMQKLEQRPERAERSKPRGYITFDQSRKWFAVTMTDRGNLSTFLHESGHAFLEMLQRDAEEGHAGSQADLVILRQWLGAPAGEPLTTEQLETFARGLEAYLMEGKAPSEELRGVFATIKAWMKNIYKTLSALEAPLTDEVRGVFDRLLASDEAIENARRKALLVPMFEGEGKVREMFDRAIEEATANLEQQAIRDFRRAVKDSLASVQQQVTEEVERDPAYNAWEVLSGRERLDGQPVPPELAGVKLDREAVLALGLEPSMNRRLRSVSAEGGVDLDSAAALLGFADGLELAKALGGLQGRAAYIKSEVTRRMTLRYPGYEASPAWLEQGAMEELHDGKGVALALLAELEAVGKHINGKAPPRSVLEALKLAAQERAAQLTGTELNPEKYRRAEAAAARAAQEAYGSKKLEEAYDAKRLQIWNHFMYQQVRKAQKEMDRIRDYLARFSDISVRRKVGLAGQQYIDSIDAILEALDLKNRSRVKLARAKSLAAYLAEMDAAGEPVAIPPELRDETALAQKNWRLRTLPELQAIEAAVVNLEHLAKMKNKLRLGKEVREFKATTEALSAHIEAKAGSRFAEKQGEDQNPGWWAKKKEWLRKGSAYLKKVEFIARALDGDEIAGFAHSLIFQPLADAEVAEVELKKQVVEKLHNLFDGMTLKERLRYDRKVDFLGTPMPLRDVLSIALNTGNLGNLERLVRGYAYRGWTEENIKARLDELLNDKDIALVEEIWRTIDSLWPHIAKLQEKFVGLAPERVEAVGYALPATGRKLSGGYFPIVKDRRRSHLAEKIAERKEGAWENNFMSPVVEHGFTKQRGADMSPLLLDLSVVPAHLSEVIHYVTHYEAVRGVDRLTQNKEVRAAITNALGRETYLELRPWLEGIAQDGKVLQLSPLDSVLRHLRFGSSIVLYGFKVTTGLMQTLGLYTAAKDIGAKHAARGVLKFARQLAAGKPFPEQSFEVREIGRHADRDIAQLLESGLSAFSTFGKAKADLAHFSLAWMLLVQKSVNAMTFYGAYEKALEDGHPNPEQYAESVVRTTQTGSGVKDLAAIQRSPEAVRMFAVAYTYFSVLFNQLGKPLPAKGKLPELAARWWWLVFLPVVTEVWMRNRKPEDGDEPEDYVKFALAEQFLYVSRTVPFWSAISESFINEREARTAPWISATLRGAAALGKLDNDKDLSPGDRRALIDALGTATHLPTGAVVNAAKYLDAFSSGSMDEPIQNLLFRSPGQFE